MLVDETQAIQVGREGEPECLETEGVEQWLRGRGGEERGALGEAGGGEGRVYRGEGGDGKGCRGGSCSLRACHYMEL